MDQAMIMCGESPVVHAQPSTDARQLFWKLSSIALATGFIGVLSGVAVCILLSEETELPASHLIGILLLSAALSFFFEWLRSTIDQHGERFSIPRVLSILLMLGLFELCISGLDRSFSLRGEALQHLYVAVLGPLAAQATPKVNLVAMVGLWGGIGALVTFALIVIVYLYSPLPANERHTLPFQCLWKIPRRGGTAVLIGVVVGGIGAPLAVLTYIVGFRVFFEFYWAATHLEEWAEHVRAAAASGNWLARVGPTHFTLQILADVAKTFQVKGAPLLALIFLCVLARVAAKKNNGVWFLGTAGAALVVFGTPLIGSSAWADAKSVSNIAILCAIIWLLPGLFLGACVPYLRGLSSDSKIWGFLACGAGCILGGFSLYLHPGLFFTASALMFGAGIWFFVRREIRQYWPVAALSIAVIVVAVTKMTVSANFLEVQERARMLIQEPLTKFSLSPAISDGLIKEFEERIAEPPEGFLRHEVESLEKELQERTEVIRKEMVVIGRKQASKKNPEPPLTLSQYATLSELHDKNVESTKRWKELIKKIGAHLNNDVCDLALLQKQVHDLQELDFLLSKWVGSFRSDLIERFELCVMCSLGFWATLGALAGWSLRRGRHSDETAQNRATTDSA